VSILELLDDDIGLGTPPFYDRKNLHIDSTIQVNTRQRDLILMTLAQQYSNSEEIVLGDELLSQLEQDDWMLHLPCSLDAYVNLVDAKSQDVDEMTVCLKHHLPLTLNSAVAGRASEE
jgi:hypothetical protein